MLCTVYEKPAPGTPASDTLIREITEKSEAVVTAYGHCGSCTTGVVKDGVAVSRSGVPSVVVIAQKFWDQSEFIADAVGMPDVPRVMIPIPWRGETDAVMADVAKGVVPDILDSSRSRPWRRSVLTARDEVTAVEQLHDLGATDGLPVVVPTRARRRPYGAHGRRSGPSARRRSATGSPLWRRSRPTR